MTGPRSLATPKKDAGGTFVIVGALMIAQQVASKAVRDSLFLANFAATQLPKAMLAGAVLSWLMVAVVTRLMSRFGPVTVARAGFALAGAGFVVEWFLLPRSREAAALLLFFQVATLGGTLTSAFWSLVNEHFDPHVMKQRVARISAGAGVGGLAGGVLAERVTHWLDSRAVLLVLLVLCLAAAALLARRSPSSQPKQPLVEEGGTSGWSSLRGSSYLKSVAALVIVTAAMTTMLDYALKARAAQSFTTDSQLTQFFATYYMVVNLGSVILQLTLTRPLLTRLGLAGTIAILPATVLLTSVLGAALTRVWTMSIVRGAAAMLENSLFRSGYEPLYTPVRPERKRAIKTVIDVVGARLGDGLGSAIVLLTIWVAPRWSDRQSVVFASFLAALALWLSLRLHRGYVRELAASLRSGLVSFGSLAPEDSTTRRTLSLTLAKLERGEADGDGKGKPALLESVALITSKDVVQARRALPHVHDDLRLAPFVIELLGRDETAPQALAALREVAPRILGQLCDALLDSRRPLVVRCRVTRVLRVCRDKRAVRGLCDALFDDAFEVRYSAALALRELVSSHPELAPPEALVLEAAEREVSVEPATWKKRNGPPLELDAHDSDHRTARGSSVSLTHVFNILSVALDAEGLRLARKALTSSDDRRRGTALEYLDSVLPENIRRDLTRHITSTLPRPSLVTSRAAPGLTLAQQLKLSMQELDVPAPKKR